MICLLYLLVRQVPIVYWSLDLGDTWMKKPDSQRIALLTKKAEGTVPLAHDFDWPDDSMVQLILESVRSARGVAKQIDMRTLTVSKLLEQHR
jgi:hypothetical protein